MIVDLHTRVWERADTLGEEVAAQLRRRRQMPWDELSAAADAHAAAMAPTEIGRAHV